MKLLSAFILLLLLAQGPLGLAQQQLNWEGGLHFTDLPSELPQPDPLSQDQETADNLDNSLEDNFDFTESPVISFFQSLAMKGLYNQDDSTLKGSHCPPFLPPEYLS